MLALLLPLPLLALARLRGLLPTLEPELELASLLVERSDHIAKLRSCHSGREDRKSGG